MFVSSPGVEHRPVAVGRRELVDGLRYERKNFLIQQVGPRRTRYTGLNELASATRQLTVCEAHELATAVLAGALAEA